MKEIRQICVYDRKIKDKYYVTDSGVVYVQVYNKRVMRQDNRRTVTKHILREAMASSQKWIVPFSDWGNYCIVLQSGVVLRRLSTRIREKCNSVDVMLITVHDVETRRYLSRVVANTFIDSVDGKEVHHIDGDRTNNHISNLQVLTFEEHRGCGNHRKNHKQ